MLILQLDMQCRERMASLLTLTGLAHETYRHMVIMMVEVILMVLVLMVSLCLSTRVLHATAPPIRQLTVSSGARVRSSISASLGSHSVSEAPRETDDVNNEAAMDTKVAGAYKSST